ncbi:SHOCT domain-containing protein [Mycobacterium sp. CBMA293]|uniref:SHOCT domain-containing protein n=2 Tax=Mycolicibacterium TaxID=1866885 RepID=UPI0012DEBED3|nr:MULTISPECIES: SHOCT domain-containing protein [unclassified Mycolicibacterium]MUL49528.1 SHOCT domain-containing protein [Mycolicibacterium sp. CBMA 360]MUL62112.1 SHOCT domain-containing protein [Mycolicibacterium sp. CBMA 335]MUL73387.1 SHOCT domain-containing protein [Mycolicibacterium sp. CBMA 311]MUL96556.1 SHOCT domain-containing protein [Mycolicibacterium sp. CBMA 230]MUM14654.1 SHOCT domain-containing protein [Mycolicibacterium sp. CBMA 293]
MLQRYLKAQVMVLLCGGLVGPIFLAVYFYLGQMYLMKWMFYVGILITAADVLVALWLANFGAKQQVKQQALEANGVLALARVTGLTETGTRINERPLVKLDLHIEGPGIAPFDAQDRVLASIPRMPLITARYLAVLVDPTTNKFQIDWQRSTLVAGIAPAQFRSDEDGRTYDLTGQVQPLMEILTILKANGVPADGTIDLRSNPAARQQVMAVVRRAAAASAPAAPAPVPAAPVPPAPAMPSQPAAGRLQELETLRAMGTISEAEYTAKRAQIIAEL